MAESWTAEREVDEHLAGLLVGEAFPSYAGMAIERLGVGFDNVAYRVGRDWVFRFPRRQIAVPLIELEAAVLPLLAVQLPLPIPVPQMISRGSPRYSWPFSGYRMLPGKSACGAALDDAARTNLARPLAEFLAVLHSMPPGPAKAFGALGDEIGRMDVAKRTAKVGNELADLAGKKALSDVAKRGLEKMIADTPALPTTDHAIVHGDLYSKHVLIDEYGSRVTGILDWGDLHVGHIAVDLSFAHLFFPPSAHDAFMGEYGSVSGATWRLARFRAICHAVVTLRYALDQKDADLERDSLQSLAWIGAKS